MLKRLTLVKYRCYDYHEVDFKQLTIIIGKNNAGKSTLIEALRIISLISNKFKTAVYKPAPVWLDFAKVQKGIIPSLDKLEFSFKNIVNQYEKPPAKIEAEFDGGEQIIIYLHPDEGIFAQVFNSNGTQVSSTKEAKNINLVSINILPQITPLLEDEKALDESYVKSNVYSTLASRHFRNQLTYFNDFFEKFSDLAAQTWNGLRVIELTKASKKIPLTDPSLLIQEGNYVTEVGQMGHGLQMWLQTMWFLARTPTENTIVLDEPDVYMHADLQRKLIRTLKNQYKQVIIATHSLEIMAEVDYENILVIDRRKGKSMFASTFPSIQSIIYNDIGSIHNLELARLWSAKKLLIVEGEEISLLKKVQDILFPFGNEPLDNIPNFNIGGWGGWGYAIGSRLVVKNAGDETIKIYCIFDSDYHLEPEINNRYSESKKNNINLHIWSMKEFENYFIIPSVILRLIKKAKHENISEEFVKEKLMSICETMRQEIEDNYASEISKYYKRQNKIIDFTDENKELSLEAKNVNRLARRIVAQKWEKNPISVVPGKTMIKEINKWLTNEFKVNINLSSIIKEMNPSEVHEEMKMVLEKIERCIDF